MGDHVNQAGSYVGPDRLRFDFSHFSPVTEEELRRVEEIVNDQILAAKDVTIEELPIDEAKNAVRLHCSAKIRQHCTRCYRTGLFHGILRRRACWQHRTDWHV